jgi:hypothetical protein
MPLRYGSVLDVAKLAVGDFGWLVGLKGPSTTTANSVSVAKNVSTVVEGAVPNAEMP